MNPKTFFGYLAHTKNSTIFHVGLVVVGVAPDVVWWVDNDGGGGGIRGGLGGDAKGVVG